MGKVRVLRESDLNLAPEEKDKVYPVTLTEAVYDENNVKLPTLLDLKEDKLDYITDRDVAAMWSDAFNV